MKSKRDLKGGRAALTLYRGIHSGFPLRERNENGTAPSPGICSPVSMLLSRKLSGRETASFFSSATHEFSERIGPLLEGNASVAARGL